MRVIGAAAWLLVVLAMYSCSRPGQDTGSPTAPGTKARQVSETMTPTSESSAQSETGVVVVQGIFDPAGENLLELKPVHRYAYSSPPLPDQPTGQFQVRVVFMDGQVTSVPFDALVADDQGRTQHGFFEVTVPVQGEIDAILITDAAGEKTFARIDGSEILPP